MVRIQRALAIENQILRQQLAALKQRQLRLRLTDADRLFWVLLSRMWSGWREPLHIVQPETVVQWHRQGFRYYWRWKSRQLAEACGIEETPRYLIRDRDGIYDEAFHRQAAALEIQKVAIAPRSPLQNPYVERVIAPIRRAFLDHMIILGECHLKPVLSS